MRGITHWYLPNRRGNDQVRQVWEDVSKNTSSVHSMIRKVVEVLNKTSKGDLFRNVCSIKS